MRRVVRRTAYAMSDARDAGPARLVTARSIAVCRGERLIVRLEDLAVDRCEPVFPIAANGAGKSTTGKAILGPVEIDEGVIERASSIRVGYVPQRLAVSPNLPLSLLRLMRLTGRYAAHDIEAALKAVGLDWLGNPQAAAVSGGEFQTACCPVESRECKPVSRRQFARRRHWARRIAEVCRW